MHNHSVNKKTREIMWTQPELATLLDLHGKYTMDEIRDIVNKKHGNNRTRVSVGNICNKRGIKVLRENQMIKMVKADMDAILKRNEHWKGSGSDNYKLALHTAGYYTLQDRLKAVGVEYGDV